MSSELDHIQLSSLLVGEWYKDALLLSPDGPPVLQRPGAPEQAAAAPPVSAPPESASPESAPPESAPPVSASLVSAPAQPAAASKSALEQPVPPHAPRMTQPSQQPIAGPAPERQTPPAPLPPKSAPAEHAPLPTPQRTTEPAPETPAPYKFLGKNAKKITIVVQAPGIPFLPDNQLMFLTKILEACRMNIGDVAIVNTSTTPVNIATLRQQLQPAVVLLFGLEPTAIKLPINFPVFKIQPYDNCSYLAAPPLPQLVQQSEESKLLKSKLWVCLKTLFNV